MRSEVSKLRAAVDACNRELAKAVADAKVSKLTTGVSLQWLMRAMCVWRT